jgi:hypothetical protein
MDGDEMEEINLLNDHMHGACRRAKIEKNREDPCNNTTTLKDNKKAELLNNQVKTDTFNLDRCSTPSLIYLLDEKSAKVKDGVLLILKQSMKTNVNPITKKKLNVNGITKPMMREMIEYVKTGKLSEKPKMVTMQLSPEDVNIIIQVRNIAMRNCNTTIAENKVSKFFSTKFGRAIPELVVHTNGIDV